MAISEWFEFEWTYDQNGQTHVKTLDYRGNPNFLPAIVRGLEKANVTDLKIFRVVKERIRVPSFYLLGATGFDVEVDGMLSVESTSETVQPD